MVGITATRDCKRVKNILLLHIHCRNWSNP